MQRIKNFFLGLNLKTTIFVVTTVLFLVLFSSASILVLIKGFPEFAVSEESVPDCNVAVIKLQGNLSTYKNGTSEEWTDETVADNVYYSIEDAGADPAIQAVVLQVDSGGGRTVAGEEISSVLKRISKPTVALIIGQGASAAYWAATGAQRIFASKYSDVGGIGISQSFVDNAAKNIREGLNYNQLSSAKYKDTFSGERFVTQEERDMVLGNLKELHKELVGDIANNRKLKYEDVAKISDGSSFFAKKALGLGLIDAIGGMYEVEQYLAETLGLKKEEIITCMYGF
ncbi:MAG: S49 family peptidase [bacterium]